MDVTPLHPRFGVEIGGVNIADVTAGNHYSEIRELFERHSLLLFRGQDMAENTHNEFAALFGPLEDRTADASQTAPRERPPLPKLSNVTADGEVMEADSSDVLNLIANQQWHTDSTFLRTPSLLNIITAHVVPSSGGETEVATTRAAFADLPDDLRARAEDAVFLHSVLPSRIRTDSKLLDLAEVNRYQGAAWRAVWPNPVTGDKALYIAGHVYAVRGMAEAEAAALVEELLAFCTRPEYVYSHAWQPGDVLVWDERATVHRGRPWPYDEERTMASCCVSVTERDGVEFVRPPDGPIREEEIFS